MGLFGPRVRTVATVGLPGHGKTVFLAGLFWDSFFALCESLRDSRCTYTVRALTAKADDVFYSNAQLLHDLILPPANPRTHPEPAVLRFTGIPYARRGWRQHWRRTLHLAFYDIAGEVFMDDSSTHEYAHYLAEASDIIFLFDPTVEDFSALTAARLVDRVYRIAPHCERKNLILTLTKMDDLYKRDEWVDIIGRFFPDSPPTASDLPGYLSEMDSISTALRHWWMDPERQARNLIEALPQSTRFCALSSLGHRPVQDDQGRLRLVRKPEPYRVRDPLFWVFRSAGVM